MRKTMIGKSPAITQKMNAGVWKTLPNLCYQFKEFIPQQSGFSSRDSKDLQPFGRCAYQTDILSEQPVYIIFMLWRLAAHNTMIITLFRNEQRIIIGVYVEPFPHTNHLLKIGRTSSSLSMMREMRYSIIALYFLHNSDAGR